MGEKVIIRSETIDLHGDLVPLSAMETYVKSVNGKRKMRYLANHRRDIPPIGYFDNAEIRTIENVNHTLVEPISFTQRHVVSWNEELFIEDAGKAIQFIVRDSYAENIEIAVDKNNFEDFSKLETTGRELTIIHQQMVSLTLNTRKSLLPDPQVVITLASYGIILYPIIKPLLAKMGEKIAEDIAEDVYRKCKSGIKVLVQKISNSVKIVRANMIPKDKVLTTILEIPGNPYIELHVRSNNSLKIEKGLKPSNLLRVHKKVLELEKMLNISEIYFILNTKDKWDFSYLITKDGQVVGTRSSFEKRDNLVNRINLSPTRAFSIGADNVQYSLRRSTE